MRKMLLILIVSVVTIGCGSENATIVDGVNNAGQTAIGGKTNSGGFGGSSNQGLGGNQQVSGGNSSVAQGGITTLITSVCIPKTCSEIAYSNAESSGVTNTQGGTINWDYISITACGNVSDGCGSVINCGNCNTCGQGVNLGIAGPVDGIAGICGETMCVYNENYNSIEPSCGGANSTKVVWYCGAGNSVGPLTETGCVTMANPNANSSLTYFCCDK